MPILEKVRNVEAESKQLVENAKTQAAQSIALEKQKYETSYNLLSEEMKAYKKKQSDLRASELNAKEAEIKASYEQAIEQDKLAAQAHISKAVAYIVQAIGEEAK